MKAKKIWALLVVMSVLSGTGVSVLAEVQGDEQYTAASEETQPMEEAQKEEEYDWRIDAGRNILTPGTDETALNFAWYSEEKGTPAVKIGTKQDLSDAVVYTGTATDIDKTTDNESGAGKTYVASNKVTTGEGAIAENTTYYYSYTSDSGENAKWSEVYTYKSHGFKNFQTILVGDPQIGASGSSGQGTVDDQNIANDLSGWQKTLGKAEEIAPDASFILSAGDQIDYSSPNKYYIRELEFAGFSFPEQLRSLPISTTIGNHESLGDDYQYHYNNPNASELGATNSGGDYYYSYGDVLFIILNSNNRNIAEHTALMNQAAASHSDAKWKVVMFHYDIYGSGEPHSDVDGANLRTIFAPLMDQFDIDICLTGHDHSYARTYQIVDGKAIDYGQTSVVDPDGTLYIAAGSASGSKYYNLNQVKQYYIAERNNTKNPTFSVIDFSENSFTIKTYDNDGNKYAGDFTIEKTENKASLLSLLSEAESAKSEDYTKKSYQAYQDAAEEARKFLETEKDEVPSELTENYDSSIQGNNDKDPLNYYGYAQGEYRAEENTRLKTGYVPFLDKTMDNSQGVTNAAVYQNLYTSLVNAKENLIKAEFTYKDVKEGEWYYEGVKDMLLREIMTGLNKESFGASEKLSRAQFLTALYRMAGSPEVTEKTTFTDVDENEWYGDAVVWGVSEGVVSGYNPTTFGPEDEISREQMVTMLYRFVKPEYKMSDALRDFKDGTAISAFAEEAMAWAVDERMIQGKEDGTLAPAEGAYRVEAAVMLSRYLNS